MNRHYALKARIIPRFSGRFNHAALAAVAAAMGEALVGAMFCLAQMRYSRTVLNWLEMKQMKKVLNGLAVLAASAWAGGMWATGYLAVPVLFYAQPDRMLAGMLAGNMFAVMAYTGMACAAYLLAYGYWQSGRQMVAQKIYWVVALMLLLTLLGQFGLQPAMAELKALALPQEVMRSEFAPRFRLLHGAASIMYLLQTRGSAG